MQSIFTLAVIILSITRYKIEKGYLDELLLSLLKIISANSSKNVKCSFLFKIKILDCVCVAYPFKDYYSASFLCFVSVR